MAPTLPISSVAAAKQKDGRSTFILGRRDERIKKTDTHWNPNTKCRDIVAESGIGGLRERLSSPVG